MEKKIEYTNGEMIIEWRPQLCIHAGVCVRTLPQVYRPAERPWVRMEFATTPEMIDQIKKCPSGALKYRMVE